MLFYEHLLARLGLSSAWKRKFEDVVGGYKLQYRVWMDETVKRRWIGVVLEGPSFEASACHGQNRERYFS